MLPLLVTVIALIFLLVASIYDLKYGEITDKINFGFILTVVILSITLSLSRMDINILLNTVSIGMGYFVVAYVLYHLGQWGGGDVKLLLGLGCTIGLLNSIGYVWNTPLLPYYLVYFIDMGVVVLPYALIYMLILSVSKPDVFKNCLEKTASMSTLILFLLAFAAPLIFYLYTASPFFILFSVVLSTFILASLFLKTSEEVLLTKTIPVSELKESDALEEDLTYNGKKIALRREIEGVNKQQLELIKKLASENKIPSQIKIRWGVKFAPIIAISFLLTVYVGDLMAILIKELINFT